MENPEEVLQALDEFQKMRPSDIPRELEEYLCFVAKTGDPVYQWSLIKPLFREKLVRVMTDFYESCPTLDLAPSPNIEHFNYDIMKCNLLELLESFANAPFTVQRICELLTAPRKEYNRVDKFMRAIEKNILVVSTREPGQTARRSENGDSMVNGSIDEDTPISQQTQEVEMDSWVKDCTTDPTIDNVTLPITERNDAAPIIESVIPDETTKDPSEECLPIVQEKDEICSKKDVNVSNFISTNHEMSTTVTLTSSLTTHEPSTCTSNGQNLSTNVEDVSGIAGDVTEAIMNEDTSSQPSLDSESDDIDSNTNHKLQTTFQSKDFAKVDTKLTKFYQKNEKTEEDETVVAHNNLENNDDNKTSFIEQDDSTTKSESNKKSFDKSQDYEDDEEISADKKIMEKRPRLEESDEIPEVAECSESIREVNCSVITTTKEEINKESVAQEDKKNVTDNIEEVELKSTDDLKSSEIQSETIIKIIPELSSNLETFETLPNEIESKKEREEAKDVSQDSDSASEASKPIIEEPEGFEETDKIIEKCQKTEKSSNVIIQEAMDDDAKTTNTTVPDSIPIVEEPKEELPSISFDEVSPAQIVELSEYTKVDIAPQPVILESSIPEQATMNAEKMIETTTESIVEPSISIEDPQETNNETMEKIEPAESMDVDGEESTSILQQDEPMEEESPDQTRS